MQQELIAGENALEFQDAESPAQDGSIWASIRNAWLLVPLVYFATAGQLGNPSAGEFASAGGYGGPTASDSLYSRGEQVVFWAISLLLMCPYYRSILRAFRQNKAMSALLTFTVLSVIWSPDFVDSLRRVALITLTVCFAYFLAERFPAEEQMRLIYMLGCVVMVMSYFAIAFLPNVGFMPTTGEWRGIFGHKNDLGLYLSFLLSPALFNPPRATLRGVAGIVCGLLGLVLIVGSQSRTGQMAAAGLIAYAALLSIMRRMKTVKERVALTVSVIGIVSAAGWLVYQNYASITYMMGKDPSLSNRGRIWAAVISSISARPLLGYGYGGFWNEIHGDSMNIIAAVGANITHAHNGYLNLALQIGLIGLGFFLFVLIVAARNAAISIYNRSSRAGAWYGGIILVTIMASMSESFFMTYNSVTTILFVMACVGLRKIATGEEVG